MTVDLTVLLSITAAVLSLASIILHIVAPRTKATWDDKLSARLDELLGIVRTIQPPAPAPPPTLVGTTNSPLVSDKFKGGPTGLVALIALGLAAMQPACATLKATPGATKVAVIECAKADAAPILEFAAKLAVQAALSALKLGAIDWPGLETAAFVRGKVDGGCALNRFVAELAKAPKSDTEVRTLVALPDPAADGRAAIARLSARFDGVTWQ